MPQKSRKFKKVDAFFSRTRPAAPDSPLSTGFTPPASVTPEEALAQDTHLESSVSAGVLSPGGARQGFTNGIGREQKVGSAYNQAKASSLEEARRVPSDNTLRVQLMVSGAAIGVIEGSGNEAGWTVEEIEIVSAVAAQLAHHIEHLRPREQNES